MVLERREEDAEWVDELEADEDEDGFSNVNPGPPYLNPGAERYRWNTEKAGAHSAWGEAVVQVLEKASGTRREKFCLDNGAVEVMARHASSNHKCNMRWGPHAVTALQIVVEAQLKLLLKRAADIRRSAPIGEQTPQRHKIIVWAYRPTLGSAQQPLHMSYSV
jgi:hypothetical protein